ncbi:MAG: FAD-dependent oxidoreductase [Hyphomicrobiaceae bacterium]
MSDLRVQCCIAGGGPAGLVLGYLLARAGVQVAVLEKHADFLRDFRGDTIHPSTLEVMRELGLVDAFLQLPHEKVSRLQAQFGDQVYTVADFSALPVGCRFIALMPQWDFLSFIAERAKPYPAFKLLMPAKAVGLIEEHGEIKGVKVETGGRVSSILADLVVAADGRHSDMRNAAGLTPQSFGAPMDVLWFRLSRRADDPATTMGRIDRGRIFIQLNRGDYWQCAYVIPKGRAEAIKAAGLDPFWDALLAAEPAFASRRSEITSVDDLKLLSVQIDRLPKWHRTGFLAIGDAAHAMSPVGGVGINLAIQDSVATANLLWQPLRSGTLTNADLARVQARRNPPTRLTQRLQITMQKAIIAPALAGEDVIRAPMPVRLLDRIPWLRQFPARLIGLGFRPEHISPALSRSFADG